MLITAKIFRAINSPIDCKKLQKDIEAFDNWCRANGLPVNIQKCAVMTFTWSESYIRFNYQRIKPLVGILY